MRPTILFFSEEQGAICQADLDYFHYMTEQSDGFGIFFGSVQMAVSK